MKKEIDKQDIDKLIKTHSHGKSEEFNKYIQEQHQELESKKEKYSNADLEAIIASEDLGRVEQAISNYEIKTDFKSAFKSASNIKDYKERKLKILQILEELKQHLTYAQDPVYVDTTDESDTEIEEIIPKMLQAGIVQGRIALPDMGKSMLTLQQIFSIARGEMPFGLPQINNLKPVRTLYFYKEEGDKKIRNRLKFNRIFAEKYNGNLTAEERKRRTELQVQNLIINACEKITNTKIFNYSNYNSIPEKTAFARSVEKEVKRLQPKIIVFDTLTKFFSADENDNGAMDDFCSWANNLRLMSCENATVILIHHPNKASEKEDVGLYSGRGGSSFSGAVRAMDALQERYLSHAEQTPSNKRIWNVGIKNNGGETRFVDLVLKHDFDCGALFVVDTENQVNDLVRRDEKPKEKSYQTINNRGYQGGGA